MKEKSSNKGQEVGNQSQSPAKKKKNFHASSKAIRIRYKNKAHADMTQEASKLNLTLAEYCRRRIDNGHVTVRYVDKKYDRILYELNMIGNNLRQTVKLFYIHQDPYSAGESVSKALEKIKGLITEVKNKISGDDGESRSNDKE